MVTPRQYTGSAIPMEGTSYEKREGGRASTGSWKEKRSQFLPPEPNQPVSP